MPEQEDREQLAGLAIHDRAVVVKDGKPGRGRVPAGLLALIWLHELGHWPASEN